MPKNHVIISADVECDGHFPPDYSMISVGMSVVGKPEINFYSEIKPISENFIPDALAVSGLDRNRLITEAPDAKTVMTNLINWLSIIKNEGPILILCAPTSFDSMFLNYYFHKFIGTNAFGLASFIDLRSYWYGKTGCNWKYTNKNIIKQLFQIDLPHTHNALDDAIEQGRCFEEMLKYDHRLVDFIEEQLKILRTQDSKIVVFRQKDRTYSIRAMLHELKTKSKIAQDFLKEVRDLISDHLPFDKRKKLNSGTK